MVDEKDESTPNLADLESGWATPRGLEVAPKAVEAPADEEPGADEDDPTEGRSSTPDLEAVDKGWLDDLFDDEADEEADEDEDEDELPDERLDPEAYAAAKKAREERAEARRVRRKAKLEAKRARQKARIEEARARQKGKAQKARSGKPKATNAKGKRPKPARTGPILTVATPADGEAPESLPPASGRVRKGTGRQLTSDAPPKVATQWKLLAVAIVVFLAAAAFAAVISR